jgi:hypothetical protein
VGFSSWSGRQRGRMVGSPWPSRRVNPVEEEPTHPNSSSLLRRYKFALHVWSTCATISCLQLRDRPLSFTLWGKYAAPMEFTECQASRLPVLGPVATRRMQVSSTSAQRGSFKPATSFVEPKNEVAKATNLAKPLLCLRPCLRSSNELRPEPRGA